MLLWRESVQLNNADCRSIYYSIIFNIPALKKDHVAQSTGIELQHTEYEWAFVLWVMYADTSHCMSVRWYVIDRKCVLWETPGLSVWQMSEDRVSLWLGCSHTHTHTHTHTCFRHENNCETLPIFICRTPDAFLYRYNV